MTGRLLTGPPSAALPPPAPLPRGTFFFEGRRETEVDINPHQCSRTYFKLVFVNFLGRTERPGEFDGRRSPFGAELRWCIWETFEESPLSNAKL